MTKSHWTIPDLIDFELLVWEEKDSSQGDKTARKKENLRLCEVEEGESRRDFFLKWVRAKRADRHPRFESVGTIACKWFNFSALLMGIIGFVLGLGVVNAFFPEVSKEVPQRPPINVISFATVCILLPILIAVGVLAICLSSQLPWTSRKVPANFRLIPWYLIKIPLQRAIERSVARVNNQTNLDPEVLMGYLKSLLTSRKSLLSDYFAVWIQTLGVGYALALPLAIFFQNAKTSQDYAWETNFDRTITPERIHSFASMVAIPWSWSIGQGEGVPSLDQVKATKFVKYSPTDANTANVWGVWATFLTLFALVYVTIPRIGLYTFSFCVSKKRLRKEDFGQARFDELEEILTPSGGWKRPNPPDPDTATEEHELTPPDTARPSHFVLAIPRDLHSDKLEEAIRTHFKRSRATEFPKSLTVPTDVTNFNTFLESLPSHAPACGSTRFVMVEDSCAPPVTAEIGKLSSIRRKLGSEAGIIVALLGPSSDHPLGDPPAENQFLAWQNKIVAMGDPNIRVLHFHDPANKLPS